MLVGDKGEVTGYELHMGITDVKEEPMFIIENRYVSGPENEGSVRESELTFGTYMHGVFDKPAFRRYFLSFVKHDGKPVERREVEDYDAIIDENLGKLAKVFEDNMDVDALLKIMGAME
jgi:adenosylcobyric acid synthase